VSEAPTTGEFSIEQYRELLRAIRTGGYRYAFFDESPAAGDLFLRHDVDLSLRSALAMAEVEAEENVQSTWFLMTRSTFYNLASSEGEHALARLRELGHRIGQHAVHPQLDLDERFDGVVAWHNPEPSFMQDEIPGAVNVMRPPFFDSDHYRSDSNQNWRGTSPREGLARGDYAWLQLLIHPEIWVYPGGTMRETMEAFLDDDRAARFEQLGRDRIDLS
jgi:hypothetical protein